MDNEDSEEHDNSEGDVINEDDEGFLLAHHSFGARVRSPDLLE